VQIGYEEEDDGFMFSRVKKKKAKDAPKAAPIPEEDAHNVEPSRARTEQQPNIPQPVKRDDDPPAPEPVKKRQKKKMSFSTPDPSDKQPVRRSKRLSEENQATSPQHRTRRKADEQPSSVANDAPPKDHSPLRVAKSRKTDKRQNQDEIPQEEAREEDANHERHSATKIALPFADTPVIKRNKEMRENKGKKCERRSSLSMRGRRASSLIDSGNSNGKCDANDGSMALTGATALPHDEVAVADFYKHIESEGLPEPRRMRQLLTWCTTRSLDQKPMGASFEESSAIAAARVIEDELLKDLANKSELSDWFSREDVPSVPKELPERPNPRNIQNTERIAELEAQIEK
jgi:kinetochore protein Mis13/DSN1